MSTRRRGAAGLGRTQILVLRLLANHSALSARDLAYHWPTLTESSARSAVNRLGDRGLVDAAGWDDRNGRTFCLTHRGVEVLNTIDPPDEDQS